LGSQYLTDEENVECFSPRASSTKWIESESSSSVGITPE